MNKKTKKTKNSKKNPKKNPKKIQKKNVSNPSHPTSPLLQDPVKDCTDETSFQQSVFPFFVTLKKTSWMELWITVIFVWITKGVEGLLRLCLLVMKSLFNCKTHIPQLGSFFL